MIIKCFMFCNARRVKENNLIKSYLKGAQSRNLQKLLLKSAERSH